MFAFEPRPGPTRARPNQKALSKIWPQPVVSKPETFLVLPSLQSPSLVPTLFTKNPTPKRQRLMRRSYCPSEHLKITPPPPPTADSFQHLGVKNTVSAIPIPIPTPSPSPASSTHPSATSQSARAPCPPARPAPTLTGGFTLQRLFIIKGLC